MRPALPPRLAVVCHDAGACNLILPWLAEAPPGLQVVMAGPALALHAARFPQRRGVDLEAALAQADFVLSGTGWASDLEHRARAGARERGLRSAAVIDHWVNYPERFERGGQVVWPDEFWVTDAHAEALAHRHFPGACVRRFDNLYLQAQAAAAGPVPAEGPLLYVLEPMRSDWGRGRAGEFQALDHFMQHRPAFGVPAGTAIRLRPHPSDPAGKYDAWIADQARRADVALDTHASLAEALRASRWVAGCESMALVVALAAGREVLCTLPPWAPPCRLPQPGLRRVLQPVAA